MSLSDLTEKSYGAVIDLTITEDDTALDISGFTSSQSAFMKAPDGKVVTKTCAFKSDGTDGVITFTIADGDLGQSGDWSIQAYIQSVSQSIYSESKPFKVGKKLLPE
jgi:hypothetical protein